MTPGDPFRLRMTAAFCVCTLALTACVPYPVYKTLQPAAQVMVNDSEGHPVPGASVTLIASAYPYGWEKTRETQLTDGAGIAHFEAHREWRAEVNFIHGSEQYFWNWCVRKDGFQTFTTTDGNADKFNPGLVAKLAVGESTPCPEGPRAPRPNNAARRSALMR